MASICLVFKWHLNTRSFGIQPLFDHSKTNKFGNQIPTVHPSNVCWERGHLYLVRVSSTINYKLLKVPHSFAELRNILYCYAFM